MIHKAEIMREWVRKHENWPLQSLLLEFGATVCVDGNTMGTFIVTLDGGNYGIILPSNMYSYKILYV